MTTNTNTNKVNNEIDKENKRKTEKTKYAEKIYNLIVKAYSKNKDISITNVEKTIKEKSNDCMYENAFSRVNFVANANKQHAMFYLRVLSKNSIYFVVNENIYNSTTNAVKSLVKKQSIKYSNSEKSKIKVVKYFVEEKNILKCAEMLVKAYSTNKQ